MWDVIKELLRQPERPRKVMIMDEAYREEPAVYHIVPRTLLWVSGGALLTSGLLMVVLVVYTPLLYWLPGQVDPEVEQQARLSALRVAALEDSLALQQAYMDDIRQLIMGDIRASGGEGAPEISPPETPARSGDASVYLPEDASPEWEDHTAPALTLTRLPLQLAAAGDGAASSPLVAGGLSLPAPPPVNGILTRGFDPRSGHFGIDFAAEEGSPVRSVGEGYVIMADWTHDGGYTIAVQHGMGYVSVYKHNQRLLKRTGDRVSAQETIALSGNSGELTTGPHLHFELWQHGLAQDPRHALLGL